MTFRQSSEGKSVRESQDVRQEKQRARRLGVCLNKRKGVDLNAKAKRSTNVTFNRVHHTRNSSRNIQHICARIRVVGNFRPISLVRNQNGYKPPKINE